MIINSEYSECCVGNSPSLTFYRRYFTGTGNDENLSAKSKKRKQRKVGLRIINIFNFINHGLTMHYYREYFKMS